MSGWIQLHRSLRKWEWYTDINTCHLFIHLLLSANHKQTKWRGQDIKAGQLMTGRKLLSTETGLTEQQIRTSLKRLESTSEITINKYNKYSIITVTNWNQYQQKNDKSTSDLTNNQPATNQQLTTSNNVNNINNVNNHSDVLNGFDIKNHLDDNAMQKAKDAASGYDLYYLIPKYNSWMVGKKMPDNPAGAFIKWCGSYTKRNPLKSAEEENKPAYNSNLTPGQQKRRDELTRKYG